MSGKDGDTMEIYKQDLVADDTVYPEFIWRRKSKKRDVPYITVSVIGFPNDEKPTDGYRISLVLNSNEHTKSKQMKVAHTFTVDDMKDAVKLAKGEIRRALFF
jgi:hypothetical protein